MRKNFIFALFLGFIWNAAPIHSQEESLSGAKVPLKEETSTTEHTIKINGETISYKATAGTMLLKDEKGDPKGTFFYVAYTKENEEDPSVRPITFCFNGGPGSSSVWLHMGLLGPKLVQLNPLKETPPPYRSVDNPYCFLDATDLVFLDPISTGYSRVSPGENASQFHGVDEDVKSVAEMIRSYTTRYNRWASPKFLAGESYGTTRAAALARYLHNELYYYLNGIVLVSAVLNFQTLSDDPGNDLAYVLYLPSYTAAAWYHKKLPKDLQSDLPSALREAQDFSLNEYASALMHGDLLNSSAREKIMNKLSRLTGLSKEFIDQVNLRIPQYRFVKELARKENRVIGTFDSRVLGVDGMNGVESYFTDPSLEAVLGVFTGCFNEYVRSDLKWVKDDEYKILTNVTPWNYGKGGRNKYLNVGEGLRDVMSKNPALHVYIACGYYDLATPYYATTYTINHLGLDPTLKENVQMSYYEGGHMMYLNEQSLMKLKKEISQFIRNSIK